MFDVKRFVDGVRDYIEKALTPLAERVKALESREPVKGEPGPAGKDGVDGAPGRDGVDGNKGEPGPAGRDGVDGKSVSIEDLEPVVERLVVERVKAEKAVLFDHVAETVSAEFAKIPVPKDGEPGRDGEKGAAGDRGEKGDAGRDGADGKSVTVDDVTPMVEAVVARHLLDFERRAYDLIQRAVDKIPAPKDGAPGKDGMDGADGFALEDLQISDDGDGTITLSFVRGELSKSMSVRYPRGDRGVFVEGSEYRKGDGVTLAGSWWVAQKDAPKGKPGASDDWRLAVKRGRDGKDGDKGDRGEKGERGLPGRDGIAHK